MRRGEIIWEFTVCLSRRKQANQLNQKGRGFRDNAVSSQLSVNQWSLRWPPPDPSSLIIHPLISSLISTLLSFFTCCFELFKWLDNELHAPAGGDHLRGFFAVRNEQFGRNFTWCDFADFFITVIVPLHVALHTHTHTRHTYALKHCLWHTHLLHTALKADYLSGYSTLDYTGLESELD